MHGSFQNRMAERSTQPKPEVGMGCTEIMYSDRHAGTITDVADNGRAFWFRRDRAIRTDSWGMSDVQEYRYERDPEAREVKVTLRKDGTWRVSGDGTVIAVGYRAEHYDYSF